MVYDSREAGETVTVIFLSLYIDNNLKPQTHLEYVCGKMQKFSYALFRLLKWWTQTLY